MSLFNLFTSGRAVATRKAPNRRARLGVAALEDRTVPTVFPIWSDGAIGIVSGFNQQYSLYATTDGGEPIYRVVTRDLEGNVLGEPVDFPVAQGWNSVRFMGSTGNDRFINYSALPTEASGNGGNDYIHGGTGNDTLHGGDHNDTLYGGAGNDVLSGGYGSDVFHGGSGTDTLKESSNSIFILTNTGMTGMGNDTLASVEKADLTGGAGGNLMDASGFSGDVTLRGGVGHDTLIGGSGDDALDGGDGADWLYGNGGADVFVGGQGVDRIHAGGDKAVDLIYVDPTDILVTVDLADSVERA
jgi:Ca2+-binding RTX toxin-like protein